MNILLFSTDERVDDKGTVQLDGPRARHLREVFGATTGKRLRAGEINGEIGEAQLTAVATGHITFTFTARHPPPAKPPLTLVLALPRPKMLRRMLRTAAECGVRELHLINARRVEKSYWQSGLLQPANLRQHLISGLEQSIDTVLPGLVLHRGFRPFAEDFLPALASGRRALLAHPSARTACPANGNEDTLIMIGPEGGFMDFEVDLAQQAGLECVSLGSRVLRAETALAALLGRFLTGS